MSGKSKFGWFGWTLSIVLFITVTGSLVLFFHLFNLDINDIFTRETTIESEEKSSESEKELSEERRQEIEEIQGTVGQEHTEIGAFIASYHKFFNETTGYGGINDLDWAEQKDTAADIMDYIDAHIDDVTSETLREDLQAIQERTSKVLENEEPEYVRDLHRYFHDLDIALNNYEGYDRIWNVTETLGHID